MNLYFKPEQISDFPADSDGMTRFIASLSADQARQCIDHELRHEKRDNVLALLSSQVSAKTPVRVAMLDVAAPGQQDKTALSYHLTEDAHAAIANALRLSRAHVRCALEGHALSDLRAALDTALALIGAR